MPTRAFEPEERFRAVADYTYDWESWIAPDGRTLWINPAVERLTGYSVEECMAMPDYPLAIVHPEDRARVGEVLGEALAGSSGNDVEFRVCDRSGAPRWVAISWQPIYADDGRCLGYRSSVRDIHERKRFEGRLREAQRVAEQAARAKSDFLAHLSHELRTPLQAIAGFSELLAGTALDPAQQGYVDTITDQTRVLLRQMEDLLHFAALDEAPPVLETAPFDLHALCRRAIDAVRPKAQSKRITLRLTIDPSAPRWVIGDATRLGQVLGNLLGNALKFTDSGLVELAVSSNDEGAVVCRVSDTGIGIPEQDLPTVLEPFAQGRAGRRAGGVGLGLAIVHRLVSAMEGHVDLTSELGAGTCVTISVPLSRTEPVEPSDKPSAREDESDVARRHPLSILVVDDSAPGRELVVELLRTFGYAPIRAASGHEAIAATRAQAFDLVLMDYQMPDLDGISTTQLIRAEQAPGRSAPAIVLLTANVFADPDAHSPRAGIDAVLVKPITRAQLRRLLERVATGRALGSGRPRAAVPCASPLLDETVIRDLRETGTADGGTMLAKIASRVLEEVPALLAQLRGPGLDPRGVGALAHRIKGDCLVVGARRTADAAQVLADLGRDAGPGDVLEAGIDGLERAWAEVVPALARALR